MPGLWELLVIAQYTLTALAAGFNALYFATRSWTERRKQVGALVLVTLNAGTLVQSLVFGLVLFRSQAGMETRTWLMAGTLSLLGTGLITLVVLRSLLWSKR